MKIKKFSMFAALILMAYGNAAFSATETITVNNKTTTTITPSSLNYAGTVSPTPIALTAGQSQTYVESGIGNVTSFHGDYSNTSGKKCHYDVASYNQTTSTSPCVYTKAAKSTGTSFATCTATVTAFSLDPSNCSVSVRFDMQ